MNKTIGRYVYNVLVALDQFGNAMLGGDPDETISGRLGKWQRGDYGPGWRRAGKVLGGVIDAGAFLLVGQRNHCLESIADDEGKDDLLRQRGSA